VVGDDIDTANSDITSGGFTPNVVYQDTPDSSQDGLVIDQTPKGNKQAQPGSIVTIYVGNYTGP
jgi:serine/threonine-protein kinase